MPNIGDIIRAHESQIIQLWRDEAREAASARGLSEVALANIMPTYLSALADAFTSGNSPVSNRTREHVQTHLSTRLRQGFDLAEILAEFVVLERCIAAAWSTLATDQQPSAIDVERLHAHFQTATTDVSETFRRHMLEDEQSEKRYLRLLQGIASNSLRDDAKPLGERLHELLAILVEAMHANCAAFLAYDLVQAKLVVRAATGAGELEAYTSSLDLDSVVNEIAAHDEPTSVYEPTSSHIEVPESLRRAGIHSVLGIRLPPRNELLGVMYIGIAEARKFTSGEIRRIASLGERLAVHLENARLFAALQEKVDALAVEKALRERFVATLAHDLRGPLAVARLSAEVLAMEPSTLDERRDLALRIERNIDRVDHMIRDLLDANRIRAGERLPLRLDSCDLTALAHRVAEEARTMHGDRFVVDADEQTIRGIWSEDELHRAMWNLVTNAVKYGAAQRPITISVRQRDHRARVSVHNSGRPIPAIEHSHIFDAYARTPSADASERPGWGLGLTLVRGVAEAHGGHVFLSSDEASGTTFTIELPLDARHALASPTEALPSTIH
jgi:signal transduction histidine kinase